MKSKLIKSIVAGVVALGVIFGGYYGYKATAGTQTVAATTQYLTRTVGKQNLQVSIQGTGAAYAANTKEVAPNNAGTIEDLTVKVGDTVKAGQKLFVSDSDDIRKSVTTAQNNLTKQNLTLASDQSAEKVDENKLAQDKLNISDAQATLTNAKAQLSKMTVTAPIGGVITAVNNSNGDSGKEGTSVLTIVDMNSIKVKVSIDELDINKVKIGQKSEISFGAIEGKTYEGVVEQIAQAGTSTNNVTTYEVVVSVNNPEGVKLGMNANVNILVENKENALVIPAEALVENDGKKYVRVESTDNTPTANNAQSTDSSAQNTTQSNNKGQATSSSGTLVEIKTGLETESYIEVTEGLTEGQKVLIKMPTTTSSTTNSSKGSGLGGEMGADMGGSRQGGSTGGAAPQGASGSGTKN